LFHDEQIAHPVILTKLGIARGVPRISKSPVTGLPASCSESPAPAAIDSGHIPRQSCTPITTHSAALHPRAFTFHCEIRHEDHSLRCPDLTRPGAGNIAIHLIGYSI
jgi:hypothetical protein